MRALGAGRRWAHASAEIRRSRPRFTNGMVLQNSNATSPPLLRPRQDGANVNVQLASGNPGFNTSFCEARGAPRGRSPARAGGEGIQFEGCSGTQVVAVVTDTGNVEEQRSSELGDTFGASHAHASVHSAVSNGTTSRARRHAELPAVHAPRERPLPGHVLEYAAAVRGTCEPAWAGTWPGRSRGCLNRAVRDSALSPAGHRATKLNRSPGRDHPGPWPSAGHGVHLDSSSRHQGPART